MAMRKFSLILVFFVIWQLEQLNTASQDWISLRGCYNYINEAGSIVPFNEPQACFDRCPSSTAVGLKNSTCICYQSYTYSGLRRDNLCGMKCPGKPWLYCGGESGSNGFINVYSKDPPETNDININTDYGFVSVSVSASGKTYSASKNDSTGRNGFICYDDIHATDPCHYVDKIPNYSWEQANENCHQSGQVLIAVSNIPRCIERNLFGGVFWIGLYRNSPGYATSATATSTSSASTSIQPKISTVSSTMTPATTTKHATVSSFSHEWTSSVNGTGTSSEGSKDVVINAVYVAVPVVAAVSAVVVVIVFICWKRKLFCFKPRHNRIAEHVEKNPNRLEINVSENSILANDHNVSLKTSDGKNITDYNKVPRSNAGNNIPTQEGFLRTDGIHNYTPDEHNEAKIANNINDTGKMDIDSKRDRTGEDLKKSGKKKKKKDKKHSKKEATDQSIVQTENSTDHLSNADIKMTDHLDTNGTNQLYSQVEHDERQEGRIRKHKKTSEGKDIKNGARVNKVDYSNLPQPNAGNNIPAQEGVLRIDGIHNHTPDEHNEAKIANNINDTGKMDVDSKRDRTGEDLKQSGKEKKKKDKKHSKKEATDQSIVQTENSTDHLSNADIKMTDHLDTNGTNQLYSQVEHDERQEGRIRKHKKTSEGKDIKNGARVNKVDYSNLPQPNAGNSIPTQEGLLRIDGIHNYTPDEHNEAEITNNVNDTGKMDVDSKRDRTGEDFKKSGKKKKKKDKKHSKKEATDQSIVQTENSTDHLSNADIKMTDHLDTNGTNQSYSHVEHDESQKGRIRKHKKTSEGKDIKNGARVNKVDYNNVSQPNAGNIIPAQERVMRIDGIHNLAHGEFKETELANNVSDTGIKDVDGHRDGMREYSERPGKKKKRKDEKYSEKEATGQSSVQIENSIDHLRNADIKTTDHVDTNDINKLYSELEHEERQEGSTRKQEK